jgi:hypothetical protein
LDDELVPLVAELGVVSGFLVRHSVDHRFFAHTHCAISSISKAQTPQHLPNRYV